MNADSQDSKIRSRFFGPLNPQIDTSPLLLNKYPPGFIDRHVGRFFQDLTGTRTPNTLLVKDYSKFRDLVLELGWNKKEERSNLIKICSFTSRVLDL